MICRLCPRRCGARRDETGGEGHCRMPALPVVARAGLHHWEEPVISGPSSASGGSGTVFFSGCPLDCVFCQNDVISHEDFGKTISVDRLAEIFRELAAQGAYNINLVNPTHFAHVLPAAIEKANLSIPYVWNSGGYDAVETVRAMAPYIQIWLPDLKYLSSAPAARYSGAADYPTVATAAIEAMFAAAGPYVLGEDGLMKKGVLIRHLLLPGGVEEAKLVMDFVARSFPPDSVLFSLLGQYLPLSRAPLFPPIDRPLRAGEGRKAADYMALLGLSGFTQDTASASEAYIPSFDLSGV